MIINFLKDRLHDARFQIGSDNCFRISASFNFMLKLIEEHEGKGSEVVSFGENSYIFYDLVGDVLLIHLNVQLGAGGKLAFMIEQIRPLT